MAASFAVLLAFLAVGASTYDLNVQQYYPGQLYPNQVRYGIFNFNPAYSRYNTLLNQENQDQNKVVVEKEKIVYVNTEYEIPEEESVRQIVKNLYPEQQQQREAVYQKNAKQVFSQYLNNLVRQIAGQQQEQEYYNREQYYPGQNQVYQGQYYQGQNYPKAIVEYIRSINSQNPSVYGQKYFQGPYQGQYQQYLNEQQLDTLINAQRYAKGLYQGQNQQYLNQQEQNALVNAQRYTQGQNQQYLNQQEQNAFVNAQRYPQGLYQGQNQQYLNQQEQNALVNAQRYTQGLYQGQNQQYLNQQRLNGQGYQWQYQPLYNSLRGYSSQLVNGIPQQFRSQNWAQNNNEDYENNYINNLY